MGAGASSLGSVKDLIGGSNLMIDDDIARALQAFLKNPKARMAFDSFVKNDSWKENNNNQDALYDLSQTVYSKFLVGETSTDDSNVLFFAAIFPLFLGSKEYIEFMQSGGLTELSEEDEEEDDDADDDDDDTSIENLSPEEVDVQNLSKEAIEETEIAYAFVAKSSMDLNIEPAKEKRPSNPRKSIVKIDPSVGTMFISCLIVAILFQLNVVGFYFSPMQSNRTPSNRSVYRRTASHGCGIS